MPTCFVSYFSDGRVWTSLSELTQKNESCGVNKYKMVSIEEFEKSLEKENTKKGLEYLVHFKLLLTY